MLKRKGEEPVYIMAEPDNQGVKRNRMGTDSETPLQPWTFTLPDTTFVYLDAVPPKPTPSRPIVKPNSHLHSELQSIVRKLSIDNTTRDLAWDYLQRLSAVDIADCQEDQHENTKDNHKAWLATALFVVNQAQALAGNGVSLTQLLKNCHVRLIQFVLHLKHFVSHFPQLPPPFVAQVGAFQHTLVTLITIFKKYEKLFSQFIYSSSTSFSSVGSSPKKKPRRPGPSSRSSTPQAPLPGMQSVPPESSQFNAAAESSVSSKTSAALPVIREDDDGRTEASEQSFSIVISPATKEEDTYYETLFGFGWLLFLSAKAEFGLSGDDADLHSMYVLLLCVLRFLFHGHDVKPPTQFKSKRDELGSVSSTPTRLVAAETAAPSSIDGAYEETLARLCTPESSKGERGVDAVLYKRVRTMQIEKWDIFITELCERDILKCPLPSASDSFAASQLSASTPTRSLSIADVAHAAAAAAAAGELSKDVVSPTSKTPVSTAPPALSTLPASRRYALIVQPSCLMTNCKSLGEMYDRQVASSSNTASGLWLDERLLLEDKLASGPASPSVGTPGRLYGKGLPAGSSSPTRAAAPASTRRLFADSGSANNSPSAPPQPSPVSVLSPPPINLTSPATSPQLGARTASPALRGRESTSILSSSPLASSLSLFSHSASSGSKSPLQTPWFSAVMRSPFFPAVPKTPVSRMMEAVSWLTGHLEAFPMGPSPALREILAASKSDPTDGITYLVTRLSAKVSFPGTSGGGFTSSVPSEVKSDKVPSSMDKPKDKCDPSDVRSEAPVDPDTKETTCHRRGLAIKLYWRVLENILIAEIQRVSTGASSVQPSAVLGNLDLSCVRRGSLDSWMVSKSFHSSLLACCFEIVIYSYKVPSLAFPRVLDLMQIKAWDFVKVIESVVKYTDGSTSVSAPSPSTLTEAPAVSNAPTLPTGLTGATSPTAQAPITLAFSIPLPRSVKTHMRDIEFRVLDSLAWRRDETLPMLLREQHYQDYLHRAMFPPSASVPSSLESVPESPSAVGGFTIPTGSPNKRKRPYQSISSSSSVSSSSASISGHGSSSPSAVSSGGLTAPEAVRNPVEPQSPFAPTSNSTLSLSNSTSHATGFKQSTAFALQVFFRKLLGLASERLELLCAENQLDIAQHHTQMIWLLLRYVMSEKYDLLYDRHLDTIILCSLYAVLNKLASRQDIKFRSIIRAYLAKWDRNSSQVVREVQVADLDAHNRTRSGATSLRSPLDASAASSSSRRVNIIQFYNNIFVPHVKTYLINMIKPRLKKNLDNKTLGPGILAASLSASSASSDSSSAFFTVGREYPGATILATSDVPRRAGRSPQRNVPNVYVSPLPDKGVVVRHSRSPMGSPSRSLTPMTKTLYAFGESPRKSLEEINEKIRTPSTLSAKKLAFGEPNRNGKSALATDQDGKDDEDENEDVSGDSGAENTYIPTSSRRRSGRAGVTVAQAAMAAVAAAAAAAAAAQSSQQPPAHRTSLLPHSNSLTTPPSYETAEEDLEEDGLNFLASASAASNSS